MTITDIIGEGKPFEPPFKTDRYGRITDKHDFAILNVQNFQYLLQRFPDDETFGVTIIAKHICELLNREHCETGGEKSRAEQAKNDCAIVISDDMEYGTPFAHGYNRGIEAGVKWADSHPIVKKETLETLIADIEAGKSKTLSEYSNKPELSQAFDAGQISVLKLLIQWINFNEEGGEK